jgi:hypothetical protein
MVRLSKQTRKRAQSPRKHRGPSRKTGPKNDALPKGYKEHMNAITGDKATELFFPKIR